MLFGFDEGEIGYSKFNKFLVEASSRNKLALKKLDNGQYEVQPIANGGAPRETRREGRTRRDDQARRSSKPKPQPKTREPKPEPPSRPAPQPKTTERRVEDLDHAYDLLRKAVSNLITENGEPARDSDIKRQILELEPGWDESELGFTKFSRFLRQAHDAEVVDLQRTSEGYYTARFPGQPVGTERPAREERQKSQEDGGRQRDRRPERTEAKREEKPVEEAGPEEEVREPKPETKPAEMPSQPEPIETKSEPETPTEKVVEVAEETIEKAETPPTPTAEGPKEEKRPSSYGRGMRRGKTADGPPPLLPGQVVGKRSGEETAGAEATQTAPTERTAPKEPEEAPEARPATQPAVEAEEPTPPAAEETSKEAPAAPEFDPDDLGLPTEEGAVIRYLSNSYQGVGQKTAEALIEEFGAAGVFNGLNAHPERVKEILGTGRRTELLLEAWNRDYRRRAEGAVGEKQPVGDTA
ncbi:MAG: OST-HTH/LOTUS domain-containing protein [Longimicrobiales bacterium]